MKLRRTSTVFLIFFLLVSFLASIRFFVAPGNSNPDTLTLTPNAVGTYSQFVEAPNGFIWGDQFESDSFGAWTSETKSSGCSYQIIANTPTPHTGSYAGQFTINATAGKTSYASKTFSAQTTINVREYVQWNSTSASGVPLLIKSSMNLLEVDPTSASTWYTQYRNGTAYKTGTVSSALYTAGSWVCIEIHAFINATNGNFTLYLNGSNVWSIQAANIDSADGGTGATGLQVGQVYSGGANAQNTTIDDVVISTAYIGTENRPPLVNDSSDNTGLQVTSNTTEKETMNLADTAQTGTINSVTAYMRAKGSGVTNQTVFVWRINSTNYESSAINLTTSYALYSETRTTNTNTSIAWTWANVNALEVGARASTLNTGTIWFSEFYIVVDYTTSVSITVTSSPTGAGFVTVDGGAITTPQTYSWTPGDSHTIAANSPVSGGTDIQYVFVSWSDAGAQSHSITVPVSPTTYTANFNQNNTDNFSSNSSFASGQTPNYEFFNVIAGTESFSSLLESNYAFGVSYTATSTSQSSLTPNYELTGVLSSILSSQSSLGTNYECLLTFPSSSSFQSSSETGYEFQAMLISSVNLASLQTSSYDLSLVALSPSVASSLLETKSEFTLLFSSYSSLSSSGTTNYGLSGVLSSLLTSTSSLNGNYELFLALPSAVSSISSQMTSYEFLLVFPSASSFASSNMTADEFALLCSSILASSSVIVTNYEFLLVLQSGSSSNSSNMTGYDFASVFSSFLSSTSSLNENYEFLLAFPSDSLSTSSETSNYEFLLAFPSNSSFASSNMSGYDVTSMLLSSVLSSSSILNTNYEFLLVLPSDSSSASSNMTGYDFASVLSSILSSQSSLNTNYEFLLALPSGSLSTTSESSSYEFILLFPSDSSFASSNSTGTSMGLMLFSSLLSSSSFLQTNYEFLLILPSDYLANSSNSVNKGVLDVFSSVLQSNSSSMMGYGLSSLMVSNANLSSQLQSNKAMGGLYASIMQAASMASFNKELLVKIGSISSFSATLDLSQLKVIVFTIVGNGSLMVNWIYVTNNTAWCYNTGDVYNLAAFAVINQTTFSNFLFNGTSYPFNPYSLAPATTGTVVANFIPISIGPSPPPPPPPSPGPAPISAPVVTLDVNVLSATFMQVFWNPQPSFDVFIVNKGIPSGDVTFNYTVTNAFTTNVVASGSQTTYITSNQGKTLTVQLPSLPAGHYFVVVSCVSPASATGNGDLIVTSPFYGQLSFLLVLMAIMIVILLLIIRRRRKQ